MRTLALGALTLALAAAPTLAQKSSAPPKLAPCDSSAVLLGAAPIFNVGAKTIVAACPTFAERIATFYSGHPALTAAELVSELLHGTMPKPPTDTVNPPPVIVPPVTPPAPSPDTNSWTFCTNAGAVCSWFGLRVVRLADAKAAHAVTATLYHTVPCANYGFNANLVGALHCDYGPALLDTLAVPVAMGPITATSIVVMRRTAAATASAPTARAPSARRQAS